MSTFYRMHSRGAYSSHLVFTVGDVAVVTLADIADDLAAAVEGDSLDGDPVDPVITGITVTPRDGGIITFSMKSAIVNAAEEDLDGDLDAGGQQIEVSLTHAPGTRSNIRAWAWKASADTVVDVNVGWTDVSVL